MEKQRLLVTVAVIAIISIFSVAVVLYISAPTDKTEIIIGALGPLTGPASYNGEEMLRGVRVAEAELNENGGILGLPVSIPFEDTKSDLEAAIAIIEKFKWNTKVDAITGFYHSGNILGASSKIAEYQLPTIAPITWSDTVTSQMNDYIFRICPTNTLIVVAGSGQAAVNMGAERIAVMASLSDYGQTGADVFTQVVEDAGLEVVIRVDFDREALSFYTELALIQAVNPDYLHLHSTGRSVMLIKKQMAELGMNFVMYSADGIMGDETVILDVMDEDEVEGATFATMYVPGTNATVNTAPFVARYKAMYGDREPHYFALHMYDGVMALADSIERAGTTAPGAIVTALEDLDLVGTRGRMQFTYTSSNPPTNLTDPLDTLYWHQWTPPIMFMQWQILGGNLTQVLIYPEELATGTLLETWT